VFAAVVQLEVWEVQMEEEALVQDPRVLARTGEPGGNGGLSKAENPFSGRWVQSFSQRSEHDGDLVSGSFQPVEGRVAPGSERAVAGLTAKGLDRLSTPMLAVPDQCMEMSVCDPEVQTLLIETCETFGVDPLGRSPSAFHLTPGAYRRRRWLST